MFYELALFLAGGVFLAGLAYRVSAWFRHRVEVKIKNTLTPDVNRIVRVIKGCAATIFSPKLIPIGQAFFRDVLVQKRILNNGKLRWIMHILIFTGVSFLFFFHALDQIIVTPFFKAFYLKVNPFLVIAGLMVLFGVAIAGYRRFYLNISGLKTRNGDLFALALLTLIVLSGLAMEMTKLTSYHYYTTIWYFHISVCLLGLAYLPFSKMIHIFTTPLSLLSNAVMNENSDPANIVTRQMMELSACMSCGTCSNQCSVAMAFEHIGNHTILPSERMRFLKAYFSDKRLSSDGLCAIQQGIYLCTNCDRCTVVCPAGINLKALWFSVREEMIHTNQAPSLVLTPFSYFRGLNKTRYDSDLYDQPLVTAIGRMTRDLAQTDPFDPVLDLTPVTSSDKYFPGLSNEADTYVYCFSCENCSTVCPVVGNYEDPEDHIDLMPHQIMRSVGLGIKDLAMGARMLWYCLTCYQCQEHCPQGVKVTDILYDLKNHSARENDCGTKNSRSEYHHDCQRIEYHRE
jgi:heterodisulfide reductase subunit C/nitrate reductase gamma subunit